MPVLFTICLSVSHSCLSTAAKIKSDAEKNHLKKQREREEAAKKCRNLSMLMNIEGWLCNGVPKDDFINASAIDHFSNCRRSDPRFDNCLRDALNSVRPYFKTGLPQYGVRPFDPFYANEVVQVRAYPMFQYRLVLRNVTEAGWTASEITRLRTNFQKNEMQFTQFFPEKRLNGDYEFEAMVFGRRITNQGSWDLLLNDYTQTMKVTRTPRTTEFGTVVYDTPMKVDVTVQFCRHLEMHISNLLGGRPLLENLADRLVNSAWPPGFFLLRPIIGDLVGTAFTQIFNENFMNFPFDRLVL